MAKFHFGAAFASQYLLYNKKKTSSQVKKNKIGTII